MVFENLMRLLQNRRVTGKPVYFEEDGEYIGTVQKVIEDPKRKTKSYVIRVNEGETVTLPAEQFEITSEGLIYIPIWYTELLATIKEMELQERLFI